MMGSHYFDSPLPRLFAHRGDSAFYPENTLPAFRSAVDAGISYLELDVWASQDGTVVVHHDSDLMRTCGLNRSVRELTLKEIRSLDAGSTFSRDGEQSFPFRNQGITVPTLAEVLLEFPQTHVNIEIKQNYPAIEEAVLKTVRTTGAEERVLIASEIDEVLNRLRFLCGDIPTNLSYGESSAFFAWLAQDGSSDFHPPGQALQIPSTYGGQQLIMPESIEAAHHLGLEVHVWTVNDPQEMSDLLELGVDGLMSDYPQRLIETVMK